MIIRIAAASGMACAIAFGIVFSARADSGLRVGAARANITPVEAGIPTQLGGYGARAGKPAEGVHDRIYAKTLVFEWGGKKAALVTLDVCSVPVCLVTESLEKAAVDGLTLDNVVFSATHTHAGIEGYSMDRRNIAGNPHIGIFNEDVLRFVSERIGQTISEANAALRPATAAYGAVRLPGIIRNRRRDNVVDEDLTVLRFDGPEGKPYAVLVNFTAHGTIMSENEMLVSGGWPGHMQRTVEALADGVVCLYTNGAEGDISPVRPDGGSRWEMAERYGRQVGIAAARLLATLTPEPVRVFDVQSRWVKLPARRAAPNFAEITGDEYKVDGAQLEALLEHMFPDTAPLYALRVNDFQMATFPGEPLCSIGLELKKRMRDAGVATPCVASLTGDHIGYILTPEAYNAGGYEATTSFYGPTLGPLLLDIATVLVHDVAKGGAS